VKPNTIKTVEDKTAPSLILRFGAEKKTGGAGAQKRQKRKVEDRRRKKE